MNVALNGQGSEVQSKALTELAQTLCTRENVQSIILAGTDWSLLFNDANAPFLHIDCASLHLREIMSQSLGPISETSSGQ